MSTLDEIKALRAALEDFREEQRVSRRERINNRPRDPERLDPTPMEVPVSAGPPTMREQMQEIIREEISSYAENHDFGSFEQEDDFEPEDEELLSLSGFEVNEAEFIPEEPPEDPAKTIDAPESPQEPSDPPQTEPPPVPATAQ